MSSLDVATARLVPVAGAGGWLARVPHAVLFSADASDEQLRELLGAAQGAASSSEVLGQVVTLLSGPASSDRPPFALLTTSGPTVVVLVYGDQTVTLEDEAGDRTDLSAGAGTWLTRSVPGAARIMLGSGEIDGFGPTDLRAGVIPARGALLLAPLSAEPAATSAPVAVEPVPVTVEPVPVAAEPARAPAEPEPSAVVSPEPVDERALGAVTPEPAAGTVAATVAPEPEVHLFDAAEEGVLESGSAPELAEAAPEPEAAPEVEPVVSAPQAAPFEPLPEAAPVMAAAPEPGFAPTSFEAVGASGPDHPLDTIPPGVGAGPQVAGRFCGRQHFNDPRDHFCRICGLPLNPESTPEVQAERPPLGVLVWDNGDSDAVSGDLVVGRDPSGDPEVTSGQVSGLTPSGHSEGMSRVHAELRLVGWEVTLADRGSTNGTFVWEEERQAWHRLESGERATVKAGAIIAFGERTATFELPNG